MIFRDMFQSGLKMANANAPALLTAFGAVGTVTTAVLTARASFEACRIIDQAEFEERAEAGDDSLRLSNADKVKMVWALYVPAAVTGTTTVAAIILSHRISSKRAAALAAAYAMSEGRLEEYKAKVQEKFGVKKAGETRDEIHQDRVNKHYEQQSKNNEALFSPHDGKVLIHEDYTGRFFWSTVEDVNRAVNEINGYINRERSARLSDFYDLIGLSHVSTSDHFGFTQHDPMELAWTTCTTPNEAQAALSFEYVHPPVMNPEAEADSFR